jgi:hypothetical protein
MQLPILALATLFLSLASALPTADIDFEDLTAHNASMLVPRKMTACNNAGLIGRPKYDPICLPANSKGKISAHNCKGKSYLCVLSGVATCYVSFFFFFLFSGMDVNGVFGRGEVVWVI